MRNRNPLIIISPARPPALDESAGRPGFASLVARVFGTSLVLLALGGVCVLSLGALGL